MKTNYRISGFSFWAIIACTLTIDGIQFLLTLTVAGSIVALVLGLLSGFCLWLTFTLHDVKYSGTRGLKKIAASFGTMVLEIIPFINALPLVTVGAFILIQQTRAEDREKQKQEEEARVQQQRQQRDQQQAQARAQQEAANDNAEEEERFADAA